MASIRTRTGSGYERVTGACKGAHYQSSHGVNIGSSYSHDGNSWMSQSGNDISTTTRTSGVKFAGKNGKSHHTHVAIGHDSGCYPMGCVSGFRFKAYWEGSGRQIYLKKWGYGLRRTNSSSQWLVQCGSGSQGSTGDRTITVTFSSDTKTKLRSGDWVFEELHLQMSTDNCCGDRTSTAYIFGFEFNWEHNGGSGKKLILPVPRSYSSRGQYRIA